MLNIMFYLPQCMNVIMLSVIMLSAVHTRLFYTPWAIYLYAWYLLVQ
jgi:hypothetical protein